jgi:hypothetical protein
MTSITGVSVLEAEACAHEEDAKKSTKEECPNEKDKDGAPAQRDGLRISGCLTEYAMARARTKPFTARTPRTAITMMSAAMVLPL